MSPAPPDGPASAWPMSEFSEPFGGEFLQWRGFANLQAALDEFLVAAAAKRYASPAAEAAALARIPYYGGLWPSARALLVMLARRRGELAGTSVLELGCGLGLPAILAARWGARVLATDYHPAVGPLLAANARRNGLASGVLRYREVDWHESPDLDERFAWIIASDILYQAGQVPAVVAALQRHLAPGGTVLLSDPGRAYVQDFASALLAAGWRVELEVERVTAEGATHDLFCLTCQPG